MTELDGYLSRQHYISDICNKIEYKEVLTESEENFVFSGIHNLKHLLRYDTSKETQLNIRRSIAIFETYIYSNSDIYNRYKNMQSNDTMETEVNNIELEQIKETYEYSNKTEVETRLAKIKEEVQAQYSDDVFVSDKAKMTVSYLKRVTLPGCLIIGAVGGFIIFPLLAGMRIFLWIYLIMLAFMSISFVCDLTYIRNLHFRKIIDELKLTELVNNEAINAIKEIEKDNTNKIEACSIENRDSLDVCNIVDLFDKF